MSTSDEITAAIRQSRWALVAGMTLMAAGELARVLGH